MRPGTVIVFGLTASGKSTLADRLGAALGKRVLHPSSLIADILAGRPMDLARTTANRGQWDTPEAIARTREPSFAAVDDQVRDVLLAEAAKGDVVIDSWTLPWIFPGGTKIRLAASADIRAARAALRSGTDIEEMRRRLDAKDETNRNYIRLRYDSDILMDFEVFDLTIETDDKDADMVCAEALAFLRP